MQIKLPSKCIVSILLLALGLADIPVTGATDIYHLKKSKDGRLQLGSYDDEKLFLQLSKDKTLKLLGVPLADTGDIFEYNCAVKSTPCSLQLFFLNGEVTFAKISAQQGYPAIPPPTSR